MPAVAQVRPRLPGRYRWLDGSALKRLGGALRKQHAEVIAERALKKGLISDEQLLMARQSLENGSERTVLDVLATRSWLVRAEIARLADAQAIDDFHAVQPRRLGA